MPEFDALPENDHVARGCLNGCDNGVITATAFAMSKRDIPLKRISVEWIECPYDKMERQNIEGAIARLKERHVTKLQPVAPLGVLEIRAINRSRFSLDVIEAGSGVGPSSCHSAICGFTGTEAVDLELQLALAEIANKNSLAWIE